MYTTKAIIEDYLGVDLDSSLQTFIKLAINGATNYIEKYCGSDRFPRRVFEKPTTDEDVTMYFDGNGTPKLPVGDVLSITSLEIDGTTQVEEQDFYLKPYNAPAEGKPYTHIELIQPSGRGNSRIGTIYTFEKDQRNVKIVGKFRYSNAVPEDIQLIATQLASETLKQKVGDQALKEVKAETFDDYKVEYLDIAKTAKSLGVNAILNQYKRKDEFASTGVVQVS